MRAVRVRGGISDPGRVRRSPATLVVAAAVAALLAGCGGGPILANDPIVFPAPPTPSARPAVAPDPIPVELPRDDGPHGRLTEWWYYTGHLRTESARRFGFEAVIFRAERGTVPVAWASHLALTDEEGATFHYAQRSEVGPQVDHSPRGETGSPTGFDLQVAGLSPALIAAGAPAFAPPWRLAGGNGTDRIEAALAPQEAAAAGADFALSLDLEATKPPALHDGDGFVEFGPAGSSYYYSRTRMAATGQLTLDGERLDVEGIAWFDHQWGDFISVGGGWDWFAINLDDGTDMTFSVVLDDRGSPVLTYGTVVSKDGSSRRVNDDEVEILTASDWLSPHTGKTYPAGWTVRFGNYEIRLTPTVADQELDARATTGVSYWEGSQDVTATRDGAPVGGEAYVEITRYGDSAP